MSMTQGYLVDNTAVVDVIDPDANAAGTITGAAVDMSKYERVTFYVMAGTLGSSATLDFKVQAATTSGGSYADVTGAAITQLTDAGTDSDKQAILEVKADHIGEGNRFIKGLLITAVATSDSGMIAIGSFARNNPPSDIASVDEVVRHTAA